MTRTYDQSLHRIWADVLSDDTVLPSEVIMESMQRSSDFGAAMLDVRQWIAKVRAEDGDVGEIDVRAYLHRHWSEVPAIHSAVLATVI